MKTEGSGTPLISTEERVSYALDRARHVLARYAGNFPTARVETLKPDEAMLSQIVLPKVEDILKGEDVSAVLLVGAWALGRVVCGAIHAQPVRAGGVIMGSRPARTDAPVTPMYSHGARTRTHAPRQVACFCIRTGCSPSPT